MTVMRSAFDESELPLLEPTEKVGLLATISPDGLPHVSLITTIQAKTPTQVIWGQFTEGFSKQYVNTNPNTAFLVMTLDRKIWRGTARYTHAEREGDDYAMFNDKPMFRYNSYFGIHTVHYMDLVGVSAREGLPLGSIIPASLLTALAAGGAKSGGTESVLSHFGHKLFTRLDAIKFVSWVKEDGFPTIVPLFQCRAADSRRLVFSPLAYSAELGTIPDGAPVAVFGMTLQAEDILVRGPFAGFSRVRGVKVGTIDVDWVYNSMPPAHGQIYPPVPLRPVVDF